MNTVILTGRVARDPELRSLASGRHITTLTLAVLMYDGERSETGPREREEYVAVVVWDRLGEIVGRYVRRGQQLAVRGSLVTRTWDDDLGRRHWRTEVAAAEVQLTGHAPAHQREAIDRALYGAERSR